MELVDVPFATGPARVCTAADDEAAAIASARVVIATLRRRLAYEARKAQALADEIMAGGWALPAPPVHIEAQAARTDHRPMAHQTGRARLVVLDR